MRRGQVAMEFILTYGWAILAVTVVLVAIGYFGAFEFDVHIPDTCRVSEEFACGDFFLAPSGIGSEMELIIINTMNRPVTLNKATLRHGTTIGNVQCGQYTDTPGTQNMAGVEPTWMLNPGQKVIIVCNPTGSSSFDFVVGEREKIEFEFNYSVGSGLLQRTAYGEIIATVQDI